ncbi:nucleotide exchange factor SIL1-like, partial [Vidua chalybeata]|uniref:nucleotide exchange factor SIL1-like n=1 Tax=Vidua chalybeata TaxID=81927 RepID=UPI0023A8EB32
MSPWAGLLSTTARVSLLLLLGSVLFSCSSLSHRVPEFALTKIEESDIKDDSGKEPGTEDDADPEDLEVFYPTDQWQTLPPDNTQKIVIPGCIWMSWSCEEVAHGDGFTGGVK